LVSKLPDIKWLWSYMRYPIMFCLFSARAICVSRPPYIYGIRFLKNVISPTVFINNNNFPLSKENRKVIKSPELFPRGRRKPHLNRFGKTAFPLLRACSFCPA